jgi:phosphoribosylformylglycinamidine synthase subunit PurL
VGLLEDADRVVKRAFRAEGDAIVLLGESRAELGGSEYLKVMHDLIRGVPPALDLARERALQKVLVEGAAEGLIRSAHDCAEGGLAVTLAESSFDTGLGLDVNVSAVETRSDSMSWRDVATLFAESASRVVVSVGHHQVKRLLEKASSEGIPASVIGRVGGDRIRIAVDGRTVVDEPLVDAEHIWSTAIGRYFDYVR